ncbi:hypothetical protein AWM68_17910 [Fictibacillus phosphorivorans]|uniref:Uncharacterized protein n=1 Tax=Fictibacillus phosphorivorans TaxID=1221500 RepID=A0A165NXF9_9BACL|nr:hypothetical protein [Fictibacillus phosphorivorans]KZE68045.1 hypothetical protein AWM68_17910 [Fictibacillus phosphorivorans]
MKKILFVLTVFISIYTCYLTTVEAAVKKESVNVEYIDDQSKYGSLGYIVNVGEKSGTLVFKIEKGENNISWEKMRAIKARPGFYLTSDPYKNYVSDQFSSFSPWLSENYGTQDMIWVDIEQPTNHLIAATYIDKPKNDSGIYYLWGPMSTTKAKVSPYKITANFVEGVDVVKELIANNGDLEEKEPVTPVPPSTQKPSEPIKPIPSKPSNPKPVPSKPSPKPTPKVTYYWNGQEVKKGQVGKITVKKDINLWKREKNKLKFVRVLKKGTSFRVYGYDKKYGGQFHLGAQHYITNMPKHVKYEKLPKTLSTSPVTKLKGTLTINKNTNLWKRENNKLVKVKVLKKGQKLKIEGYDPRFGGQYVVVGGKTFVTNTKGYITFKKG